MTHPNVPVPVPSLTPQQIEAKAEAERLRVAQAAIDAKHLRGEK